MNPNQLNDLLSTLTSQQEKYLLALRSIVQAYNTNPDSLPQESQEILKKMAPTLASQGLILKQPVQNLDKQQAIAENLLNLPPQRIANLQDNIFVPAAMALSQISPENIIPAHLDKALLGLATDMQTYLPAIYSLLDPNSAIKDTAYAYGMDKFAQQKPELVLPEQLKKSLEGLESNHDLFRPVLAHLADIYNQTQGQTGANGQLSSTAAATLLANQDQLSKAVPPITLNPAQPQKPELAAALTSEADSDLLNKLDDNTVTTGLAHLLENSSQSISPQQVGRVLQGLDENPEQYKEIATQLADKFNQSDATQTNQPLEKDSIMVLASQAESLQNNGINLDTNNLEKVFHDAMTRGMDIKGMNTLEEAVRDIPRQLSSKPGHEKAQSMAISVSGLGSTTKSKQEFAREKMAKEHLNLDSGDLADYSHNAKTASDANLIAPDTNLS
ncbi:MAG TPA: hypothetical protein ENN77_02325 [Candidatus Wirthbacteria bacterium]|nr:hypothetical protein [Candidatus Wirthbacteria bacterium]